MCYITDPAKMKVLVKDLLSESFANKRRNLIQETALLPEPSEPNDSGTVYSVRLIIKEIWSPISRAIIRDLVPGWWYPVQVSHFKIAGLTSLLTQVMTIVWLLEKGHTTPSFLVL